MRKKKVLIIFSDSISKTNANYIPFASIFTICDDLRETGKYEVFSCSYIKKSKTFVNYMESFDSILNFSGKII